MPKSDSDTREITPRNIVWVEDFPPDFGAQDHVHLTISHFTHAIICFFHLDPGPKLVYNGAGRDPDSPQFQPWWDFLRNDIGSKTLMLSVGGWNSSTWKYAQGQEATGAREIVDFARRQGFAGIDFNFEGPYNENPDWLAPFGKMVVEVRKIWDGLFTITPMRGNLASQLKYIQQAAGHPVTWKNYLSWINVQFYTFVNSKPNPDKDVPAEYENVLASYQLPASMVAVGFPLSEQDLQFNIGELEVAVGAVQTIYSNHPDFAGLFVWRFRGAFMGNTRGHALNWALRFSQILHIPT